MSADSPASTDEANDDRLLIALGGACLSTLALALLDASLVLVREVREIDPGVTARVFIVCALASATAGALAAVITAFATKRWSGRRFAPILWSLLAAGAIAGLVFDKWAFVHRYPYFHTLLAMGTTLSAALAGSLAASDRLPRRLAIVSLCAGVGAALAGSLLGGALIGDSQVMRVVVPEHSTWGRVLGSLWIPEQEPSEFGAGECEFPPAQPVTPSASAPARGFNVLWVSIDAVRGDLGGDTLTKTWPRTTEALPGAFRFDRAHAAGTRTTESVYSMLTGRWPHELLFRPTVADQQDRFRVLEDDDPRVLDPASWKQHHPLPVEDDHPSLAAVLESAGYRTAAVAVGLFMLPDAGLTNDFGTVDIETYRKLRSGELPSESYSAGTASDRLIAFIDQEDPRPFFAWAHYLDPHVPYEVDDPALADAPAPARYLEEIRRTEAEVARLVEHLRTRGLLDRTIVVVTSDHGEEFRDHGGLLHGTTVYQELMHVPLLLWVPTMSGRPVDLRMTLVDLPPTLVDLLGIATEVSWSGRSLGPVLRGEPQQPRPILGMSTLHETRTAVIDEGYKLIEHDSEAVELYALDEDPTERRNRADDEPERVARLRCLLRAAGAR